MNSLENIRDVSFHSRETGFVEFDASRAGFLDAEHYFPDSRDVKLCLDGTEDLSWPWPILLCASCTIQLARIVFPQTSGTLMLDLKLLSETK